MSELTFHITSLQTGPWAAEVDAEPAGSTALVIDTGVAFTKEEWEAQLQSLQECICDLLIKNQQLRMALIEVKTRELGLAYV